MATLAFFFFLITRVTTPDMALLYGNLAVQDSSQIIAKLESMGVPYKISGNGTQIFVPAPRVQRLRMSMAENGLPAGGSVGYEIFDRSSGIGSSSFVQNINRLRALEGELARSIRTMRGVRSARVHLVLPQRRLFSREAEPPTASIALQLVGGITLGAEQVSAIRYLVAAAVPDLKPENVSVVDSRGELLARSGDGDSTGAILSRNQDLRQAYEQRLGRKVEELLERSLGPGAVRAEVSAQIDFDRVSTNEESYNPDSQVVRSTQVVTQKSASRDGQKSAPVSVSTQLPGGTPPDTSGLHQSTENSDRTEETTNYEISKVVKSRVKEPGQIERLSVAVLVDGTYGPPDKSGKRTYKPRSKEELNRIKALVQSAIGYNAKRGDTVQVVNMRFAKHSEKQVEAPPTPLLNLDKNDYFRIGEILILLITGVLALLFVVRPLLKRLLDFVPPPVSPGAAQKQLPAGQDDAQAALPQPDDREGSGAMIDIDQVEGRVRESSLRKVGEIVNHHPEESVSILRNWMFNEG